MNHHSPSIRIFCVSLLIFSAISADNTKRVLFIAGPKSHAPGEHEHPNGCSLLATALNQSQLAIHADVSLGWPNPPTDLQTYDALVFYSDGTNLHPAITHAQEILAWYQPHKGISFIHWSIEPNSPEIKNLLTQTIGGYFDVDSSVNPIWKMENPTLSKHAITQGVQPFSLTDELYFNLSFPPSQSPITPILTAIPPVSSIGPDGCRTGNPNLRSAIQQHTPQTLAWCIEHPNLSRGFAFSGGHFHHNWNNPNLRTLILNGIAWSANLTIPTSGIPHPSPIIPTHPSIEMAIAKGDLNDVKLHCQLNPSAIHQGSSPQAKPPLELAILRNQVEICRWLLEHGAPPNPPQSKRPLAILAIERKNLETLKLLIQYHANLNAQDPAGWTPLHHAAAKNQVQATQLLLAAGANPNQLSQLGGTPLHEAAASGSREIIQLLLKHSCNPSTRSSQGTTALDIATQFKNQEAIDILSNLTKNP